MAHPPKPAQAPRKLRKPFFPERDLAKYPNPQDEPEAEGRARLGLREMEPGEDILSWGQNPFLPKTGPEK